MTHDEVVESWLRREPPCKGSSMFHDGDVIYSWGTHWPIARWWGTLVLYNPMGVYRSVSTRTHSRLVLFKTEHVISVASYLPEHWDDVMSGRMHICAAALEVARAIRDKENSLYEARAKRRREYMKDYLEDQRLNDVNYLHRMFNEEFDFDPTPPTTRRLLVKLVSERGLSRWLQEVFRTYPNLLLRGNGSELRRMIKAHDILIQ